MKRYEKDLLNQVNEKVVFCLYRGIDKNQIAEWLDDVIYNLSEDTSYELFKILCRIQDNLSLGNEIINEF